MIDVCIIGFGPVGATLAILLEKRGLSVAVLEREAGPYPLPRAAAFDDEIMRVFQTLGVSGDLLPHTCLSPGMRFIGSDGSVLLDWARPAATGPLGWNASYRFHQPDLERVLREKVATRPHIAVRLGTLVTSVSHARESVTVHFTDRRTDVPGRLEARYAVGCDGARSFVRDAIGAPLEDLGFNERWIVIDAILRRPAPHLGDYSLQHCNPDRPATYIRGVGDRRRWEIALRPGEDPVAMTQPAMIQQLLSPWIAPGDADVERAVCYTFTSAVASAWREGRLLIAGDAAHQMPPFLGQGMCAGIRDAANLAWKLARVCRGEADAALLDTYGSEREPHVREYIALAVRLGGLINTTNPAAALAGMQAEAGAPARMASIRPALGPGLSAGNATLAGTVAPQPRLSDGVLLDDRTGYGFALLCRDDLVLPATVHADCQNAGVTVVADEATGLQSWLREVGAAAVMVRPDRYILGMACPGERQLHDIEELLAGAAPASHTTIREEVVA